MNNSAEVNKFHADPIREELPAPIGKLISRAIPTYKLMGIREQATSAIIVGLREDEETGA
jgi:hypothetical protein